MIDSWKERVKGKELRFFCYYTFFLLLAAAFLWDNPWKILQGLRLVIISRDALITDYFALAGYGAGFANAAFVYGIGLFLIIRQKIPFTGLTLSALFINAGYAFWGKNPVNILPLLFGVFLYAKMHHSTFQRYLYTALFGTCLAPVITEFVYILPFGHLGNLVTAACLGLLIGILLPPLVAHTPAMHQGYTLFNAGFAAGFFAFALVCLLKSFGINSSPVFIWQHGRPLGLVIGLLLYFSSAIFFGLILTHFHPNELPDLMKHPGRAIADFVLMDGVGASLINMGLMGMCCTLYILLIGGDFSGPVVGAILTVFGFSSFGSHPRNTLPVMGGVFLFALITPMSPTTPGLQLAAVFSAGLAPVAGEFGIIAGLLGGMLHGAISINAAEIYGGMNLYNNGFSTGWAAILMVPCLESFQRRISTRRGK
jgi:hypothetical protein